MTKDQLLEIDTLRYRKNKLPANLALLGLVFNCLYFCLLYGQKTVYQSNSEKTWFVSILIGCSVIATLIVLLVAFLASEGIKGYNKKFCYVLIVLAVWQIARIFIYPLYGLRENILNVAYFWIRPENSVFEFIMMLIWLCASAACFIAAAVIGYINCKKLEDHIKRINSGEVNIDELFAEDKNQMVAGDKALNAASGDTTKEVE